MNNNTCIIIFLCSTNIHMLDYDWCRARSPTMYDLRYKHVDYQQTGRLHHMKKNDFVKGFILAICVGEF